MLKCDKVWGQFEKNVYVLRWMLQVPPPVPEKVMQADRKTGRQTDKKPAELTLPLSTWTDPPSLSAVRWEPSSSRLVTGVGCDSLPFPSGD